MHLSPTVFALSVLITFCTSHEYLTENNLESSFEVIYQWTFLNFTWKNQEDYNNAIKTQKYIPKNNVMSGFRFFKDKLFFAMPRMCPGSPVTLGYISSNSNEKTNRLVTPAPDWDTNDLTKHSCDKLESVQTIEIDTNGIMWVLDGHRLRPETKCPAKLVLYDLNNDFNIVHTFTFPETICSSKGGFLNDIVVDDSDGGFAYMTDASYIDPGLIVYSREKDRSWKLRDASMFAEIPASNFVVDDIVVDKLQPVDGIALSPKDASGARHVYYCALTGLSLYTISTDILKNESLFSEADWRYRVTFVGRKQAQSDGIIMDNKGNLYYGLLPFFGVGKWNIHRSEPSIVGQNRETMKWVDSFAFDDKGYLYVVANDIHTFLVPEPCKVSMPKKPKFRMLKHFTGTKSYLY